MAQTHYVVTPDETTAFPEADHETPWHARREAGALFEALVLTNQSARLVRLPDDAPAPTWDSLHRAA